MTDPYIGINGTKIDFFDNEVGAVKTLKVLDELKSKIITATRDMTAATGYVTYIGAGFTPTSVIALAVINTTFSFSIGFADSTEAGQCISQYGANQLTISNFLLNMITGAGASQSIYIENYTGDGFQAAWDKSGSPTGTATLYFLCLR